MAILLFYYFFISWSLTVTEYNADRKVIPMNMKFLLYPIKGEMEVFISRSVVKIGNGL